MNPYPHQLGGIDFILSRGGSGGLMFDVGLGKTWTALMCYEKLKEKDPTLRLLVVCPLSLLEHTWLDHVKKLYPAWTYSNLRDDKHWKESDVSVINFDNIIRKSTLNKITTLISHGNWMCVIDESSRLKDPKSLTTKTMIFLRDKFKYRIVMSGTPAPNSEAEYWAQLEFIERGSLHPSYFAFRNTYFYLSDPKGRPLSAMPNREAMSQLFRRGARYVPVKSKRPELMNRIGKYVKFAKKEDCLKDLPEALEEIRDVELSQYERSVYNEMKRHLVIEIEKEQISANNALTKLLKLREVCSGFVINENQKNIPICINATIPTKLKIFKDLLEEIGSEQAIVWINFHFEAECIENLLRDMGKTYSTLHGKTTDRDQSINDFKSGASQFIICHPLSAGHGLNLQNAHISIHYSLNYSHEQKVQTEGRIHRSGQTSKCLFIYLICKNTIEEDIWDVLTNKKEAVQILEGYLKK